MRAIQRHQAGADDERRAPSPTMNIDFSLITKARKVNQNAVAFTALSAREPLGQRGSAADDGGDDRDPVADEDPLEHHAPLDGWQGLRAGAPSGRPPVAGLQRRSRAVSGTLELTAIGEPAMRPRLMSSRPTEWPDSCVRRFAMYSSVTRLALQVIRVDCGSSHPRKTAAHASGSGSDRRRWRAWHRADQLREVNCDRLVVRQGFE